MVNDQNSENNEDEHITVTHGSNDSSESQLAAADDEPKDIVPKDNTKVKETPVFTSPSQSEINPKPKKRWFRPEIIFFPRLRKKLGRFARPLAIVVIAVVVLGGGGLVYWRTTANRSPNVAAKSSFKLTVAAFRLVSTTPSNKATNVNPSTTIVLNFNQPVTAAKLINNMFITPKVTGTYKQGANSDQVVFTPTTPFAQGTKVAIMINGTYENNRGSQLGNPYGYGFTTAIPSNGIEFQDQNGLIDQVTSLATGQKEAYTLLLGSNVTAGASVTLYKGDTSDLLSSLVYSTSPANGTTFNNLSASTSDLQKVASVANVINNQTYNVTEPDGLYVAVATDATGTEVGMVWIDFSDFGVLMRQDDQKIVYDAQSFSNSQDVSANISFYDLNDSVNLLKQQTVSGLTSTDFPYSPSVDLAIATYNGETAIVPINILDSGGDIRVDRDLSTAQQGYGITDKPTYQAGDSVNYAGFVRDDNDAQYTNPATGTVNLYVAQYKDGTPLTSFSDSIDENGMFSGTFKTDASWLNSGDNFDQFQIFASAVDGNSTNDIPVASFSLSSQANPSSSLTVKFSKASYLPSDPITATITGTNSSGQPLANTAVDVHIFSQDYYENDQAANLENFGYLGNELPNSPLSVTLNAQGQAVYTLNPASLPNDSNSQMVTIQANLPGQSGVGAAGGDLAIVHQGDAELTFGSNRSTIPNGDDLISDVYVNHLNGNDMGSTTVNYTLTDSNTLASGSVQTNSGGLAEIDIPSSDLGSNGDYMELEVSVTDEYGNTVNAETYYSTEYSGEENQDSYGAGLMDLNVTGSSSDVNVGDTVNLTINSPANIKALVTFDRGRIYNPAMVNLTQGNNSYSFTVSSSLAPSFTLTFNYFLDGVYHSEGASFNVSDGTQNATVKLTTPSQTVTADKPTTVQVNTTDNTGDPIATSMIVDVVSTNAYDLSSDVNPDIFNMLYQPRPIMTSSASSLSPVGSGGGGCGGGGGDLPSFANAIGTTLYWQPELNTDSNGQASFSFTPPSGSWIINVYAMSGTTQVGDAQTTITAQ